MFKATDTGLLISDLTYIKCTSQNKILMENHPYFIPNGIEINDEN